MKVLTSNYSSASQTVLKAIMIKLGHQMEVVSDGKAALAALQRPDAPKMAILDSNLPGLDGFEVCRRMKAEPVDPELYVVLMTGQNDRSEVLKALDAKADDYLQKPFDLTEVAARMRIAGRMMKQRRDLLFTMASIRSASAGITAEAPQAAANVSEPGEHIHPPSRPLFPEQHKALNSLAAFANCEKLLVEALAGMGLGEATPLHAGTAELNPELSIMSVVVIPQKEVWLDMVLETDLASAGAIFKAMTGMEEASHDDCRDLAGEIQNIFQGTIKAALQDEHLDVLTPVIPMRIPAGKRDSIFKTAPECMEVAFTIPGAVLKVMLFPHVAPVTGKSLCDVKLRDVVAEPVNLPGEAKLTLLNKGIMMNDHHIQKLQEMTGYGSVKMTFNMIVPSEISLRLVAA